MRNHPLYIFIIAVGFCSCAYSQSITAKESGALQGALSEFFNRNIPNNEMFPRSKIGAPLEAFICLLKIDSAGKIVHVNFLANDKFKDSAYSIFSKMKPSDFKNWQVEKCKTKTIAIPIFMLSNGGGHKYINEASGLAGFKPGETESLIIVRGIDFSWPRIIEESPPNKTVPVEPKVKQN